MVESLKHRGPDHQQIHLTDRFGAGHTRLSLLDPQPRSHQPFVEDQHVLIYNGEIYNYPALRSELEQDGIAFSTTSDTEVLFRALLHWGVEDVVKKCDGMFAFAFYHAEQRELILVRDRLGIKPLYYAYHQGTLYFASEIKAILATGCSFAIDPIHTLQAPLGNLERTNRATAFQDIYHLQAGTLLRIPADHPTQGRLEHWFRTTDWIDESYYRELDRAAPAEIQERFQQLFSNAIESTLLADAGMGALVSGGVDSALCAAQAHRHRPINLYSANVVGPMSELEQAKKTARHLDTSIRHVDYHHQDFLRHLTQITWHYEAPLAINFNGVPFSQVAGLASQSGDKAVLTGEGSDELFLGYPKLLTRRYDTLLRGPINALQKAYELVPPLARYVKSSPSIEMLRELVTQCSGIEAARYDKAQKDAFSFLGSPKKVEDQARSLNLLRSSLIPLLWRNDRMGMMQGIESRFPFLDEAVVRFAINLPVRYKTGRSHRFGNWKHPFLVDKQIVRHLAATCLPQSIAYQSKIGFPITSPAKIPFPIEFFRHGFWHDFTRLDDDGLSLLHSRANANLRYRLAATEIWGRLFVRREPLEQVQEFVLRHWPRTATS